MNKYLECRKGNMPLIISVPHGGALILQHIQNRDFGSYKKDKNTILVAKEIENEFAKIGFRPYVICMNVHRRKIDVNRGSKEGAQHPEMLVLYKDYHKTIMDWRKSIQKRYGYCFLIDLHGQKEKRGFIEIGYGLPKEYLSSLDNLDSEILKKYSSARYLIERSGSTRDIIVGKKSLGNLLSSQKYKIFPSEDCQHIEEAHYNGVYILRRHVVKRNKAKIFGINLELCFAGIRDTEKNRQEFAELLTGAIIKYLKINMGTNQTWLKK